jgi:hypothetical protein
MASIKLQNAFTDIALKRTNGTVWVNSPSGELYWAVTDAEAVLQHKAKHDPDRDQYRVELHFPKDDLPQLAQEYEDTLVATFGKKTLSKARLLGDLIKPAKVYKGKDDDGDAVYEELDDKVSLTFASNFAYPDGNVNPYAAPKLFTGAGELFEGRIGNGSIGYVQFQPIPYEPYKKNPKYGIKLNLAGIYIENLVEVGSGSGESAPAIKFKGQDADIHAPIKPQQKSKLKGTSPASSHLDDLNDEVPF